MTMKNPTMSVYEMKDESRYNVFDIIAKNDMKIIMVKGIGYVVVNQNQNDPEMFRRMGEVVAKAYEEPPFVPSGNPILDSERRMEIARRKLMENDNG